MGRYVVFVSISSSGRSGLGILGPSGGSSGIGDGFGYIIWVIISHHKVEANSCYYSRNNMVTNNDGLV